MEISKIGSSNLMLPAAVAIALWLQTGGARRLCLYWCLLFGGGLLLVAASKIAFAGWGIGIPVLDFTGFSGHAMRSAAIVPTLFYLLFLPRSPAMRWSAVIVGIGLAALISLSRVMLHFHAASEALSGWLLGMAVCLSFIWRAENWPRPVMHRALVAGSFAVLLAASWLKPIPTQRLIEDSAHWLSGHPAAAVGSRRQAAATSLQIN